jgi:uncharacterized cupin superfamily protein
MIGEASLEDVGSGHAPVTGGWFVVNVGDAAWLANERFGGRCVFEADRRVLRERPELVVQRFPQLGVTLQVVQPGQPSGLYHAESAQEDFLVLAGKCLAIVEGEERALRAWDFLHCPPGTAHCFVGAGEGPCLILMVGARSESKEIRYPRSEVALHFGAGVEEETSSPSTAYTPFPHWQPARPERWNDLPWTGH